MVINFNKLITLIALFFSSLVFGNTDEVPPDAVLISAQTFEHQNQKYLAVSYKNHKGWHTYWKNPGDAGLPIKIKFLSNAQEQSLEELEWPAPKRYIEQGNMWAYGYGTQHSIFFKLTPDQVSKFNGKKFDVHSNWLVCKHICVPGKFELTGNFSGGEYTADNNQIKVESSELVSRLNNLPQEIEFPTNLDMVLAKSESKDGLVLYYNLSNVNGKYPVGGKKPSHTFSSLTFYLCPRRALPRQKRKYLCQISH